ncbi:hypothetical protein CJ030_MR3G026637 [Morella rubra]|uniref:Uncharacterized protein n=1 Tax=Morella rubra TaxID=262757 RepID=A0A6A1W3R4_9ROSI|nr:hypothetical protein CJ030_MR3G026637 [Morella rubra]
MEENMPKLVQEDEDVHENEPKAENEEEYEYHGSCADEGSHCDDTCYRNLLHHFAHLSSRFARSPSSQVSRRERSDSGRRSNVRFSTGGSDFIRCLVERTVKQTNGRDQVRKLVTTEDSNTKRPAKQQLQPPRSSCLFLAGSTAPRAGASMASVIEQKLVGSKGYEPLASLLISKTRALLFEHSLAWKEVLSHSAPRLSGVVPSSAGLLEGIFLLPGIQVFGLDLRTFLSFAWRKTKDTKEVPKTWFWNDHPILGDWRLIVWYSSGVVSWSACSGISAWHGVAEPTATGQPLSLDHSVPAV